MTVSFLTLMLFAPAPVLVDAKDLDVRFVIDIRYATSDNFMHQKLYPVARCLLRPEVGAMLGRAQRYLDQHHHGYVLMLKDCYRPHSVQLQMWAVVKGTPQQAYVADPTPGSVHNFGAAVDLTLADAGGHEVDMGTPYDFFGPLAEPRHEERLLKEGKLTAAEVAARKMLRDAMVKGGGFKAIPNEWWHFDAWQGKALRAKYEILDVPLDAIR
ncbi:MAG: M15 family metallopeptidase [Deltaproteobacteria bacterium]|nr:M15 family metallopeptidase [Deltaproteobacteria bacterium]